MEQFALVINDPPKTDVIAECRIGNADAMRELFVAHQRRVYSIALNFFSGDVEKAEDVTQQVFLKVFTRMSFRGHSEFTTWLYRMTVNACIDETRRARRLFGLTDWFSTGEPAAKFSLDEKIESHEIATQVQGAMGSLKPKYRLPIVLKYVEGLSYQEIANVLDCSIGTVSSRMSRGHKILAEKLGHLRGEI